MTSYESFRVACDNPGPRKRYIWADIKKAQAFAQALVKYLQNESAYSVSDSSEHYHSV